jgi:hypothetical protein
VNDAMPFDHIVVVMMENHSFDNLLGELPRSGQPAADGLTFDGAGMATNTNPGHEGDGARGEGVRVPVDRPGDARLADLERDSRADRRGQDVERR